MTVGVGPDGDCDTIGEALNELRVFAGVRNGGLTEIRLLSGFVMAEQVKIAALDLSWLTVTADDDEVPVERAAVPAGDGAWVADSLATLPQIDAMFAMDDSGAADANVRIFDVKRGSRIMFGPDGGGRGAAQRILQVIHGSICVATSGVTIDGALDIGVRLANASIMSAPFSTITDCNGSNVVVGSASNLQMSNSTCTGAGGSNVVVSPGPAMVVANKSDLTGATNYAVNAGNQGQVYVTGSDLTGGGVLSNNGSYVDAQGVTKAAGDPLRELNGGVVYTG